MKPADAFTWTVIGAGPAGITAVGTLLDNGVDAARIAWIDPAFQVGDFGTVWQNVSANTRVLEFVRLFDACASFAYGDERPDFAIHAMDPESYCSLRDVAEPLRWITRRLRARVTTLEGFAQAVELRGGRRHVRLADGRVVDTDNVVLATGCEPDSLALGGVEEISLGIALDPQKLASAAGAPDRVAVFGSSHSAMLVLRTLIERCGVAEAVNFYRAPLRYSIRRPDGVLFDDTGLKGTTAQWARANVDGTWPAALQRFTASEENLTRELPRCTKAVYAVGFTRRTLPTVDGFPHMPPYDHHTGIIAPGLFGCGFGFPEIDTDAFGALAKRVGILKFQRYIQRVVPIWRSYAAAFTSAL